MKSILTVSLVLFAMISVGLAQVESFSLRNLDGDLVDMEEYLGKSPVILDFWATWCKPCVKNLPKLQKLYEQYEAKGLKVFAINEDGPRSISKVNPFVNSLGLTFPVLLDENRDVMLGYNIPGLPTTLLIDRDKKQVFTLNGYRPGDEEKLVEQIEKLLGEQTK